MKLIDDSELPVLLEQLRQGEERAFNTIYKAYFKPLYRKVFSMIKDEMIADELIQDLFLKVWHKREEINPKQSFQAYLYTVANNLVFDYFRKIAKDKRLTARLLIHATDFYMHSDELLESKESMQLLLKAIDQLSPQRKLVFTCCKLEGKSYEEASKELGISVATVNSHMTQSLRTVREYILKNYDVAVVSVLVCSTITVTEHILYPHLL
ncbi:RNA polymerase sigma-70 factor (ECF subfamily) [Mucilaginibacter gracilis]|uniref:RNA polymerase sigma-70 factor (ECF subfamily) n=1 Tax=Mucilaginibacter gracilis TaxID=423350 RepID=A0A495J1T6_9SPHI|nr:sigma-70 family RNA polymerase sigma factor [Mucilaginibacter gracilis]RKR82925.1 RNA polymerase sigma-70 factor (ECF subfamily) [Mucilaginibacter gracilis]